ncbi:hypothetical protein VE03_06992 [Pseudogymnoascus sp. 23342-1-I1]|nr:hypothetical protein VE03_06992 [Pseudogymnoascus sp. 23342-1-I1]
MITLENLLNTIRHDADADAIVAIAETLVLDEDRAEFERGAKVLWAKEGEGVEWRREVALQMGWGCIGVYLAERAYEEYWDREYPKTNDGLLNDLEEQCVLVAELVEEYVLVLNKEKRMPAWVVMRGVPRGERFTTRKSESWLVRCFEV